MLGHDSFRVILDRLASYPELTDWLSLSSLVQFIQHASCLKDNILLVHPHSYSPCEAPPFLPAIIEDFLVDVTFMPVARVRECWHAFKDLVWDDAYVSTLRFEPHTSFGTFGVHRGLSMSHRDRRGSLLICDG